MLHYREPDLNVSKSNKATVTLPTLKVINLHLVSCRR